MSYERKNVAISAMVGVLLAGLIITGTTLTGLPALQPMVGTPTETTTVTTTPPPETITPPSATTTVTTTAPPTTTTVTSTPPPETTTVTPPPPTTTTPPPDEGPEMGTLVLMLTDAPSRTLKYLYIEIDEVKLHRNESMGEPWLDFPVTPTWYNLTALQGDPDVIGVGSVPDGNYTKIWLHILNANATFAESPDENVTLTVVANGWLKIPVHFEVEGGSYSVVILDFDIEQSHISAANVLRPVIKPVE